MKAPNLLASFRFAFEGIAYAFRTQRNFKVHCTITAAIIVAGLWVGLPLEQWAILAVVTGVVFHAELVNTALEAVVDKASPEIHPLAKIAKDCAAASVLVAAIMAVVVGLLILGPKLLARLTL